MRITIFALLFALSQCLLSAAHDAPVATRSLLKRPNKYGTIKALLRTGKPRRQVRDSVVHGRQLISCAAGNLPCNDGVGCCPVGYYCTVSDGQPGCCPNDATCIGSSGGCADADDILCPDDSNFCCPADNIDPSITTKKPLTTSAENPFPSTFTLHSLSTNSQLFNTLSSTVRLPTSVIAAGPINQITNTPANGDSTNSNPKGRQIMSMWCSWECGGNSMANIGISFKEPRP
ncbi:hypothetical protein E4T56_gene16163 [Termitomyces sp. T112]|nr:hypothetical protein E4T56_gene16163 [Termitomyces sp. T112]